MFSLFTIIVGLGGVGYDCEAQVIVSSNPSRALYTFGVLAFPGFDVSCGFKDFLENVLLNPRFVVAGHESFALCGEGDHFLVASDERAEVAAGQVGVDCARVEHVPRPE